MPLTRLLEGGSFDPEHVALIASAYESCLRTIGLRDRRDPMTELVAKKIIEIAQSGERDPDCMCDRAQRDLGLRASRQ